MTTTGFRLPHLVLLCFCLAAPVSAEEITPERAAMLAGSCANCHGTEGRLSGAMPALAGRDANVLEDLLLSFKHEQNPEATVMDRLAQGYSDAELTALAEYFAGLEEQNDE